MNVLLLSPDAVGGTLLERLLTVYMQFHEYNKPVLNVTHPEGGVGHYFSEDFNQEILTKRDMPYGYYQSLDEVVRLFRSVDHYTVTKLTYHSMRARQDPASQTVPFYQYFNENFFVIACRRESVFENALSWGITKISKARNVYSHHSKIMSFLDYYKDGVEVDPQSMIDSLEQYKSYLQWVEDNFAPASYYYYERNAYDIERYILNLPIFNGQPEKKGWSDVFGQTFNDWNRCHFLASDIGSIALQNPQAYPAIAQNIKNNTPLDASAELDWTMPRVFLKAYQDCAANTWPAIQNARDFETLPEYIKQECDELHHITEHLAHNVLHRNVAANLPTDHHQFLSQHAERYLTAVGAIERMQQLDIAMGLPPIKKQTLAEKKLIIRNFDQCAEVYNTWIEQNPDIGTPVTTESLQQLSVNERKFWYGPTGTQLTDQSKI